MILDLSSRQALARDIHVNVTGRGAHLGAKPLARLLEFLLRWSHQRGVIRHRQSSEALLVKRPFSLPTTSAHSQLPRSRRMRSPLEKDALAIRHTLPEPAFFSASRQHCSNTGWSKTCNRQHGLLSDLSSFLHGLASKLDKLQSILKTKNSCSTKCCVLTQ